MLEALDSLEKTGSIDKARLAEGRKRVASMDARAAVLDTTLAVQRPAMERIDPLYDYFNGRNEAEWRATNESTFDTENAKLTIALSPRPNTSAKAVEIVQQFAVQRRFRSILSTGVLVTGLPQPNYERVTRVASGDSTYQTYADQNRSLLSVFSPSLQYNMSFADLGSPRSGVPALVSFGVAARSVGDQLLPEPFAGLSLGLVDRLLLTGGVHFGRREDLLIVGDNEDPADIEKRAIPDEITPGEAIGTKWKGALFISISLRT
jgi:hypothetical protein